MTHICASKLIIIGSDNGMKPEWHQATRTSAGIFSNGFSEIVSEFIQENTLENGVYEIAAILSRPQYMKTGSAGICRHN